MGSIDDEWNNFLSNVDINNKNTFDYNSKEYNNEKINSNNEINETKLIEKYNNEKIPKCSDIYISTTTKIAFLNQNIDIYNLFWKIPIIDYYIPENGIIKKQIKITSFDEEQRLKIENFKKITENCNERIISHYDNPKSKARVNYKHVEIVSVGIAKKDITSYRIKEKGAFYNCFALIFRLFYNNEWKEVHVKVFNTGKLEIPGIQNIEVLFLTLNLLIKILEPLIQDFKNDYSLKLTYNKENIDTVLINSNFKCGYFVDRFKLYNKLKFEYNLLCMYDPCSYPGVQCKFYYNKDKKIQDGICKCKTKCTKKGKGYGEGQCLELSFMVFRTGSILIVGHCNEDILYEIYLFLKKILEKEWRELSNGVQENPLQKKAVNKKMKKIELVIDNEYLHYYLPLQNDIINSDKNSDEESKNNINYNSSNNNKNNNNCNSDITEYINKFKNKSISKNLLTSI